MPERYHTFWWYLYNANDWLSTRYWPVLWTKGHSRFIEESIFAQDECFHGFIMARWKKAVSRWAFYGLSVAINILLYKALWASSLLGFWQLRKQQYLHYLPLHELISYGVMLCYIMLCCGRYRVKHFFFVAVINLASTDKALITAGEKKSFC